MVLAKASSVEAVQRVIDSALKHRSFISDIYALGLTEAEVRAEIDNYLPQMTSFMTKHVASEPHYQPDNDMR